MPKIMRTLRPEPLPRLAELACEEEGDAELSERRAAVGLITPPATLEDCEALLKLVLLAIDMAICPAVRAEDPALQGESEMEHASLWLVRARQAVQASRNFISRPAS